ncbi:triose-phosphate transporter family-domain-containing protein [Thelephora terrestris]|uniref:Triose-phosphate transporter family-domain-containing protein n=1 Tax=Thelephora terrestris TaxID=56493 RepID=A0A9P6LDE3_9AGAM|nr:triose-phosphate transporter family-domain-containing protein [Thelephora terrestris]
MASSSPQQYTLLNSEPERVRASEDEDRETYEPILDNEPFHHIQSIHYATEAEKKRLWGRNAVINTLFIASWYLFATILSVYNKWMFSPNLFGFPAPLFVTALHMFVQFSLSALIRALWPHHFRPKARPTPNEYLRKAAPTAITTSLDIGFSNLSMKTITLSFYTMCKSSSLIFVLAFAFLFRLETFSFRLIGVISLIFCGVLLMVATETHFVFGGFILVISASALSGLRWSLTHLLLKNKQLGLDNPAATLFWLSPMMGLTLGVISLLIESWSTIFRDFYGSFGDAARSTLYLVSPGIVAFCMVLSEFYIIKRAGVVPMSIAGIAKEVTTIAASAVVFGDELTPLNITGVGITIAGICLYTYHKYRKSIDSQVPLDPDGNPISDEGGGALHDQVLFALDEEDGGEPELVERRTG